MPSFPIENNSSPQETVILRFFVPPGCKSYSYFLIQALPLRSCLDNCPRAWCIFFSLGSQIFGLLRHLLDICPFLCQRKHSASRYLHCYLPQSVAPGPCWLSCRSSIRFNAGKCCISPPLAILGVESLAFFKGVSIEIASFIQQHALNLFVCLFHTLTDHVTSLLRYSENHVLKGKYLIVFSLSGSYDSPDITERNV